MGGANGCRLELMRANESKNQQKPAKPAKASKGQQEPGNASEM